MRTLLTAGFALALAGCLNADGNSNRRRSQPDQSVSERMAAARGATSRPATDADADSRARTAPVTPATQASAPADAPPAGGSAARLLSPGRAIATVNDLTINRAEFLRILLDARGLPVLQQVLVREVARQEALRLGLTLTQEALNREYDVALRGERFNGKDIEALTPTRREQLIDEWTRSRGVSRAELAVAMERQALLRMIAGEQLRDAVIDDARIELEYRREYGERVEVRHIQFSNERVHAQIRRRLEQGDRFEDLVADYSQNALTKIRQGLMPAFTREDETVPPVLAAAAFALKPGDVSNPIEVDGYFHVLKLERRIPAQTVPMEDVREKLQRGIRSRLIEERMERIGRRLLMAARLHIDDASLRTQYAEQQRSGRIEGPPLTGQ